MARIGTEEYKCVPFKERRRHQKWWFLSQSASGAPSAAVAGRMTRRRAWQYAISDRLFR
jgi:hypothetical protein